MAAQRYNKKLKVKKEKRKIIRLGVVFPGKLCHLRGKAATESLLFFVLPKEILRIAWRFGGFAFVPVEVGKIVSLRLCVLLAHPKHQ